MEKAEHGDLETYINYALKKWNGKSYKLWENAILIILVQILRGLKEIHEEGVIHRDIKPKNILVFDNDLIKIWDFGVSICSSSSK